MGRVMSLDYGAKTVGIALSDPMRTIASPLETVKRNKEGQLRATLRRITGLVKENDVDLILVGLPLHMEGTESERSERSREFAGILTKRLISEGLGHVKVRLYDERLTTVEAQEILEEAEVPRSERKQYSDHIAAAVILEDFLSEEERKGEPGS